jgi:hypothetical protein
VTEPTAPLVELTEAERELAWSRWLVLAPTVEDGVPLTRSASHAGVPVSRLVGGWRAIAAPGWRGWPGARAVIEVTAAPIAQAAPSTAAIARRVQRIARERGWRDPLSARSPASSARSIRV